MTTSKQAMTGQLCMITGATSGIGEVTALEVARLGARLILVGRNAEKGAATLKRIKEATGNNQLEFMRADFSELAQVRQLAQAFEERYAGLDVLINNACAVFMKRQESVDGFEMTFAVNHLAPFLLTNLLLDRLKTNAPARIVNVSSDAHHQGKMYFDDLQLKEGYSMMRAYAQSKLANILFTYELDKRLSGTGVTVNALHPGFVRTNLGGNHGWLSKILLPIVFLFAKSREDGAQTSIYLATSAEVEGVSGKYFVKQKAKRSSRISYDEANAQRLWGLSEDLTK